MSETTAYVAMLRDGFAAYRELRFAGQNYLFEERVAGGPVVFRREHAAANLIIPPTANPEQRERIIRFVPVSQRHVHFGSMQSSQALAQSVFATIAVLGRLPLLSDVTAEDGRPAFGPSPGSAKLYLEKTIPTLGEPRPTSIDAWLDGPYCVAIECKLSEADFGTCSRPRLRPDKPTFAKQFCDGTYTRQRGRESRCSLSEIGVRYWCYIPGLFGWSADIDHRPCPLASTYQLARSALAACVDADGVFDAGRGHALILYDARNPTLDRGGKGYSQWQSANAELQAAGVLRRLSWQAFLSQFPPDIVLDWFKAELGAKFGIVPR